MLGSPADANTTSSVICTVAASAGTFAIPSHMLFTLANTNNAIFTFELGNQGPATSSPFPASGVDVGLAQTFIGGVGFSGFSITN